MDRPSRRRHESANEEDKDCQKETRENSMAANDSPSLSPAKTVSAKREPSTELVDDTEDKLALDDNTVMEDEGTSDSITRSSKAHKLSSRVEPTNRDDFNKEDDDLENIPSETSLQDGRWRNGNTRRYTNDYVRERRHEMIDRKRISSRAYETMPYPNRVWEQPYPARPVRGPERLRESDTFWRERKTMVTERNDKDDGFKIRERSSRAREWKDEDYHRREKTAKGETDRCRREKDKKVEDQYHNSRHKDDSYREREVEDKHRLKHSYDDHRSRRAVEKDDNQFIDKRQHKENEDYHTHEKRSNNKERSSRVHNSRPGDLDKISKDTHKESTRKNQDPETQYSSSHGKRKHEDSTKDSEASAQYSSSHSKRKHEGNANREKVSTKLIDGEQKQEKDAHRHEDENETNRGSKRGRSKVERWSSDIKEIDIPTNDDIITLTNEPTKPGGNSDASHPDRHLDPETLEKLKRRRERFKTPLTSEKDTSSSKKLNKNDLRLNQNETHTEESEAKHERPPRKRRWTSN